MNTQMVYDPLCDTPFKIEINYLGVSMRTCAFTKAMKTLKGR